MIDKVVIEEKLKQIHSYWEPVIIGRLNHQLVKLVKCKGEFIWHHHENEDEMFWVLDGHLKILTPGKEIDLAPGEFAIIPKKTEHKPVALPEASVLLFEPASTLNTGNINNELTRENLEEI